MVAPARNCYFRKKSAVPISISMTCFLYISLGGQFKAAVLKRFNQAESLNFQASKEPLLKPIYQETMAPYSGGQ